MIRKHIYYVILLQLFLTECEIKWQIENKNISFSKINAIALYTSFIIGAHAL